MRTIKNKIEKYQTQLLVAGALASSAALVAFFGISGATNYLLFPIITLAIWTLSKKVFSEKSKRRDWLFAAFLAAPLALTFIIRSKITWSSSILAETSFIDVIYFLALAWLFILAAQLLLRFAASKQHKLEKTPAKSWLFYAAIIFACWLPYFIIFFPGISGGWDSFWQIAQTMGISELSNHHPIAHTFLIGIFIHIGLWFDSLTLGIALYSLAQMAIVSLTLGYAVRFISNLGAPKPLKIATLLFFALNPVIAIYALTPWKDVLFGCFLLLLSLVLFSIIRDQKNFLTNRKRILALFACLVLTCLFRNNGVFIVALVGVVLLFALRQYWKVISAVLLSTGVIVAIVQGPIFAALNVVQPPFLESVGVPLQQIGYVAKYGTLTEGQREKLSQIIEPEALAEAFNPSTPDDIKNAIGYSPFVEENKGEFIKLWLDIMLTNKNIIGYIKSYALVTAPYWQVGYANWCCNYNNAQPVEYPEHRDTGHRDFDLFSEWLGLSIREDFGVAIEKVRNSMAVGWLFDIGANSWLMLATIVVLLYKRQYKYLLVVMPTFGLWATLMIASPLAVSFRYIFAIHLSVPIFLLLIWLPGATKRSSERHKKLG